MPSQAMSPRTPLSIAMKNFSPVSLARHRTRKRTILRAARIRPDRCRLNTKTSFPAHRPRFHCIGFRYAPSNLCAMIIVGTIAVVPGRENPSVSGPCAPSKHSSTYGRGGTRACPRRKPKDACGSPNRGFSTPRSPGRALSNAWPMDASSRGRCHACSGFHRHHDVGAERHDAVRSRHAAAVAALRDRRPLSGPRCR